MRTLTDRDRAILEHVALYRLGLRETLGHIFFNGKSPGNVLQALRKDTYLQEVPLRGSINYYQLTDDAIKALSLKRHLAKPFKAGEAELHRHLAILWFCTMGKKRRHLLEKGELRHSLDAEKVPAVPHCAEKLETDKQARPILIYRLYVPETADNAQALKRVQYHLEEAQRDAVLKPLHQARLYGLAVLPDTKERASALGKLIDKAHLHDLAPIRVEAAPSPETLSRFLRDTQTSSL